MPTENDGNVYCRACRGRRVGWAPTATEQARIIRRHIEVFHPEQNT